MTDQYEGERNAAGDEEGWGRMCYANGDVYEGEFNEGEKEGLGTYRYADGTVYEGELKADTMDGRGLFRYSDGFVEIGRYRAGQHVGEGAQWSADRSTAVRMQDGKAGEAISLEEAKKIADKIGLSVPPADDECEYEGECNAAGLAERRCTVRWPNGDVYEGECKAGEFEGRGTMRYGNGCVHEGEWKAGLREGRGTYRHADGTVYEGEYKANMKEGPGKFRLADGNVVLGVWREGAPVGEGVGWSADRQTAGRMQDGETVEGISLEEAKKIADAIGLPVPPAEP